MELISFQKNRIKTNETEEISHIWELFQLNIMMTDEVFSWYKEELDLNEETSVRFFVRYGGIGGQIPGFSLGISEAEPDNMHTSTKMKGITFFIEEDDVWYFEGKDLIITFDEQLKEPRFTYQ